jgi:hypothetical protein
LSLLFGDSVRGRPFLPWTYFQETSEEFKRHSSLLIGGKKTGGARWYEQYVPLAERIYKEHLKPLKDDQGGAI